MSEVLWFTWRPVGSRAFLASSYGAEMGEINLHLELENGVALFIETWLFLLFSYTGLFCSFRCRLGGEQEDMALQVGTFEHSPALP